MTDELDEILNIHTIDAGNRVLKLIDVNEAKQAIQALIDRECNKARQEEWAKIHTRYQHGSIKGQYKILEAVRRVGKNTKFRVECLGCHAVMFRYANKFNLRHSNCAAELSNKENK